MAVAFAAVGPSSAGQVASASTSISWSHTCAGSDRLLIVAVTVGASPDSGITTSATYGGVAMTSVGLVHSNSSTAGYVQMFRLVAPATGANTVVVTASATVATLIGGSVSFTGVDQSAPLGSPVTGAGTGVPSVTVTGTISGNMVVNAVANGAGITSSGQTLRWNRNANVDSAAGNGAQATAAGGGSVVMSYTVTSDWWGMVAVEVLAVAIILEEKVPFTIPNAADAAFAAQAEPDSRDFDIITAAAAQTGVVTGCTVTTTGAANGSVSVAAGTVRVGGRKIAVAAGTVGPLGANATGNPRFDLITVDTSGTKAVVAGTASATPAFPAIPSSRVVLAAVYVATGHTTTTTLAANTITDKRVTISDAELENVFWYGATGNARSFVVTAGTAGAGTVTSSLATPTGVGTTTSTTTGVLAAGTYGYRVSAFNQYGETLASTSVTRVTTGTTSTVTVSWTAVPGAIGYKVYGRTSGSELFLQNVQAPLTSYTDRGEVSPSGALPGANTTGPFTAAMVGRAVYISGAGTAGAQYAGTVSAFTSATQITVSPNLATTAPAGATAAVGTDDSAAIDAAVASLTSGSTLYFPAGLYLDTTGVFITGKYNITVTGDYATIICAAESVAVIQIQSSAQLSIDKLRLQHATNTIRNGSGYGIQLKWCQDVSIEGNYVFQTCAAGVVLDGVTRGTVVANTVKDTMADGIHTTNASTDIDVVGNRVIDVGDDGVAFVSYRKDGNQVQRFTATTNTITRCNARGIGVIGAAYGSIVGNTINQTKGAGIILAQEESPYFTYGVNDITVEGNTIVGANTYNSPTADHAAIHIPAFNASFPVTGNSIIGNHIRAPRRYGLYLDGTHNVIASNSFIGPSTDIVSAVVLGGSARFFGNRIAFAKQHGVELWGTFAVVYDNEFYYPNQANETNRFGIVHNSGTAYIRDNISIPDPASQLLAPVGTSAPTVAAVAGATGAGTTPPTPTVANGDYDQSGTVSFGTGSGTLGTGAYVTVTFKSARAFIPRVVLTPANQATAVKQPYVTNVTAASFQIGLGVAGAVSQAATTYAVAWSLNEG